jgi:uncharacterized protein YkwD
MCATAQSAASPDERKLLALVNLEREKGGIPKLAWNELLSKSAQGHAIRMAQHARLSHQFDGEPVLIERIGATGLRFENSAENVATAYSVEEAHEALMKSAPHRAAILNGEYNAGGMAIIARGDEFYVVENFARVIPAYTASQFRDAVITAVNKERRSHGSLAVDARADSKLDQIACSNSPDAQQVIASIHDVSDVVIYTTSVPERLPQYMQKATMESKVKRMILGVCFVPNRDQGYANFRVVVAMFATIY